MLWLDLETVGTSDLELVGGHVYARGARVILGAGFAGPEAPTLFVWTPCTDVDSGRVARAWRAAGGPPCEVIVDTETTAPPVELVDRGREEGAVAHNAEGFDRLVWEWRGWPRLRWLDSMPRARRLVLPGGLDALSERVLGLGKDPHGERLIKLVGRMVKPEDMAECHATDLAAYCVRDVALLVRLWNTLDLGRPHADDDTLEASDAVNRRGVLVDLAGVDRLLGIRADLDQLAVADATRYAPAVVQRAGDAAVRTWLRSPVQLGAWLGERGYPLPDVRAGTLRALLGEGPPPDDLAAEALRNCPPPGDDVRVVIEARFAVARVAGGKLRALRAWASADGRVRGSLVYHRAHTGRWAGRGPQLQNMPRLPEALEDVDLETLTVGQVRDVARAERLRSGQVVGALVRRCLTAPVKHDLVSIDFSQVEARGVLFLAGDPGLEVFRRRDAGGPDPYVVRASAIFGVEPAAVTGPQRQVGKIATLLLGFGGGPVALLRGAGGRLPVADLDPRVVVESWRDAHPAVAGRRDGGAWDREGAKQTRRRGGWWRELAACWRGALDGESRGGWRLDPSGAGRDPAGAWASPGDVVYTLPSGRELRYRAAAIEPRPSRWRPGETDLVTTYLAPSGARVATYSGKLAENCVQAWCRDLMAAALVRLTRAGYAVVLTVHDELVFELLVDQSHDAALALASEVPAWAHGFPLAASVSRGPRYG